jgi:hypothetical protein
MRDFMVLSSDERDGVIWSAGRKHAEIIAKPNVLLRVSPELTLRASSSIASRADRFLVTPSAAHRARIERGHDGTFAISTSSDLQYSRGSLEIHDYDRHYYEIYLCK